MHAPGEGQREEFERSTGSGLQSFLGVRVTFESVDANTLERAEHKSRRVVDERAQLRRSTDKGDKK